ncbi:MAG: MFS transporter [Halolamina sp.]
MLLPLYALRLGGGAFYVGVMASTAAFAGVPGAVLWGRLASRSGRRRPFVLLALVATAAVLLVSTLLRSPAALVVANAALWFAVSAAAPVLNLVVVEGVEQAAWDARIARLNTLQGYGWLAGLVVCTGWTLVAPWVGYTSVAAQRTLLTGLGLLGVLATTVFVRFYPDVSSVRDQRFLRGYRSIGQSDLGAGRFVRAVPYGPSRIYWALRTLRGGPLSNRFGRPLLGYLLGTAVFHAGFSVFWGPMPAHLTDLGFGNGTVFLCFLGSTVGATLFYDPVGWLVEHFAPATLQYSALVTRAVLFVGTAFLATQLLVGSAFAAVGVTWAVIAVTTTGIVARLAPQHLRGEALGLVAALAGLGGGIGNAVGGALAAATNPITTFGLAAAVVLIGTSIAVNAVRPSRVRP